MRGLTGTVLTALATIVGLSYPSSTPLTAEEATLCRICEPGGGGGVTGPNEGWNCAYSSPGYKGCTIAGGMCSNYVWAHCGVASLQVIPVGLDGTLIWVAAADAPPMQPASDGYTRLCDGAIVARGPHHAVEVAWETPSQIRI